MNFSEKLLFFWKHRKEVHEISKSFDEIKEVYVKDGIKTTEFWGKTLIQLLVIVNMFLGTGIPPEQGSAIVGGIEALYLVCRTIVKAVQDRK